MQLQQVVVRPPWCEQLNKNRSRLNSVLT
jgi:hypothetical protein